LNQSQNSSQSTEQVLARVRSLESRAVRDKEKRFWIEGVRHFVQASDARLDFEAVIHSPVLLKSPLAQMLVRRLSAAGVPRWQVSPEQFRRVSASRHASGIGAIVSQHWPSLRQVHARRGLGWLVVESLRSPGNLGTILRTAEATGLTGVVFVGRQCDPFDPAVVRASMGGIFPLRLVRLAPEELSDWAAGQGITLVGLSPRADRVWTELPPDRGIGLVVGDERSGLSERMREHCELTVRLPMVGRADSLNVAVAAGVVMYELVRRSQSLVIADPATTASSDADRQSPDIVASRRE
jgi:TrmH family RNA methyltransferase